MFVAGEEYRFIYINDPPEPYGFGLDDPDYDYWVVPAHGHKPRVYFRSKLPVEHGQPVDPWQLIPEYSHPLYALAYFLSNLYMSCPHQRPVVGRIWMRADAGREPSQFIVEVNCDEMGCSEEYPLRDPRCSMRYIVDYHRDNIFQIE